MNKLKNVTIYLKLIVILLIIISCGSCDSDQGRINCSPKSYVNAHYNLNLGQFAPLSSVGYVVLDRDGTNGVSGLIIVNTGLNIFAYDRNAPHICPEPNTILQVVDDIKVVCPKDGAEWALNSGVPLNDATNGIPLYQYRVVREGNFISIFN